MPNKLIMITLFLWGAVLGCKNGTKDSIDPGKKAATDSRYSKNDELLRGAKQEVSKSSKTATDKAWKGQMGKNIPIFLHYHHIPKTQFVEGEITYRNTKNKTPIALTGTIQKSGAIHFLEHKSKGLVTGVINAEINTGSFTGKWHTPGSKNPKTYALDLQKSDSIIASKNAAVKPEHIFGTYHYRFGKIGYEGHLEFKKISGHRAVLSIFSVTAAPARNIADGVHHDTIPLPVKTDFIHNVSGPKNCKVRLQFFNDFVQITYPQGADCENAFGMNATYEGLYYKTETPK